MFLAPPRFLKESEDRVTLKVGVAHVAEVPFSAYPMPKAAWTFNSGRYNDTKRFKDETIIGMTSLQMSKVVRKDTGKYKVKLSNEHGSCEYTLHLTVLGKESVHILLQYTTSKRRY